MSKNVTDVNSFEEFLHQEFQQIYEYAKELVEFHGQIMPFVRYLVEHPVGYELSSVMMLPMENKDFTAAVIHMTCKLIQAVGYFFVSESWMITVPVEESHAISKEIETKSLVDIDTPHKKEVLWLMYCGQGGSCTTFAEITNQPDGSRVLGELTERLLAEEVSGRFVNLGNVAVHKEDLI